MYDGLEEARTALNELHDREKDRASRLDYLRFQHEELERVDPAPGELEDIEIELSKLKSLDLLKGATQQAGEVLYDGDEAVYEKLSAIAQSLADAARHDPVLSESAETLTDAAASVEDIARFLSKYERNLEADPERLETLEDRREILTTLCRKHGTDLDGAVALKTTIAEEIRTLEGYEEALGEAERRVAERLAAAETLAKKLSEERRKSAKKLSKAVVRELEDLMFAKAGFEVVVDGEKTLGPTGLDAVEFLAALNPGEGAHPIQKSASGGELSRLMLAIKRAIAGVGPVGTHIFDEVDSGIGGPTASAVGRKLKEVSDCHQVICITHLPQIAGMADAHFFVSKKEEDGRTATAVERLANADRVEELARMLAGDKVTDTTRAAAHELIGG